MENLQNGCLLRRTSYELVIKEQCVWNRRPIGHCFRKTFQKNHIYNEIQFLELHKNVLSLWIITCSNSIIVVCVSVDWFIGGKTCYIRDIHFSSWSIMCHINSDVLWLVLEHIFIHTPFSHKWYISAKYSLAFRRTIIILVILPKLVFWIWSTVHKIRRHK